MKFLNNIEVGSSPNFTLPLSDGSANQILQTNGSGTVTWVDLPAGTTDTNDYVTAAAFNTSTGVVTLTVQNQTAVTVNLDGRYLTAHPNIAAASSSNNSGQTFIQDITLDSNGHVTGIGTATGYTDWKLVNGAGNVSGDVEDGMYIQIANSTFSGTGTLVDPVLVSIGTSVVAGSGLDISGNTLSVETDLRDGIRYIGEDTNDYIVFNAATGTQTQVYVGGSIIAAFRNDGAPEFHCDGDIIGFSSTISDRRLKKDIEPIENASEKVSQLRGVEYTWDKGSRKDKREIGLIAQEVEEVIPEIVHENTLPIFSGLDDSSTSYKTVDYEKLIALLIESNKEQQDIIAQLEERVIDLENRL